MNNDKVKEEKKFNPKGQDGKRKMIACKTFKSKVKGLEEAVFESGVMKHATQFTETLKEIAKYVQKKYNNDVAKMIKDVEHPIFNFPRVLFPRSWNNDSRKSLRNGYLRPEKGL